MRKLLTVSQMREADKDFVEVNNLSSADLMEKAAEAFVSVFCGLIPDKAQSVLILCGTGNNGGDGLAIARLLHNTGYSSIRVLIVPSNKESEDFLINLRRLEKIPIPIRNWNELIRISENVVIDAILGSGLNRPIEGSLSTLINYINQSNKHVIAVDCPTGFRCEGELISDEVVLKATDVICFHRSKLNFMFPESAPFLKHFHVVDIGLREEFIETVPSDFYIVESADISRIYRKRESFSHKGTFGHAFIYAGSRGKSGAAILCATACVYAGAGLTSVCLPAQDRLALHVRLPEAMYLPLKSIWTDTEWKKFSAVAMGPGLGNRRFKLESIITSAKSPVVFDADALNFIATNPDYLKEIEEGARPILTPHMKEFDRLFGKSKSWWSRLQLAIVKAKEYNITIILKNRYTFIVLADGRVLINPTGNPGMASGGMGDVLTGILVSFLAQGYNAEEACVLACYLHGKAGDLLAASGSAVITASKLIEKLPYVIGDID